MDHRMDINRKWPSCLQTFTRFIKSKVQVFLQVITSDWWVEFIEKKPRKLIWKWNQALKLKEAGEYLEHMKALENSEKLYNEMIEKVELQIVEWKGKIDMISERLKNDTKPEFYEMQDFINDRLTSFGCAKHQGYVMEGFELDSESASYLFLEPSEDGFEFNAVTKPDYVILMNRVVDQDICAEMEKFKIHDEDNSEMNVNLKNY